MRKLIIGAVTAVALLGAPAVAEAATAAPPERTPVTDPLNSGSPNGSITLRPATTAYSRFTSPLSQTTNSWT